MPYNGKKILQKVAEMLTDKKVVNHPSNVAMVQLDTATSENRYMLLFPWKKLYYHYAYPVEVFNVEVNNFLKRCNDMVVYKPTCSKVWNLLKRDNLNHLDRIAILQQVAEELLHIVFYVSITEEIYKEAVAKHTNWGFRDLFHTDSGKYTSHRPQREHYEKSTQHEGHWEYGLILEEFFLGIKPNNLFYATYFIRREETKIDLIAAVCSTEAQARKFGEAIESEIRFLTRYGAQKKPLAKTNRRLKENDVKKIQNKVLNILNNNIPRSIEKLRDRHMKAISHFKQLNDHEAILTVHKYLSDNGNKLDPNYDFVDFYDNVIMQVSVK